MFKDFRDEKPIFDAIRVVGGKFTQRDVYAIQGAIAAARRLQDDKPIFDVARQLDDDDDGLSQAEVDTINTGLAAARDGRADLPGTGNDRQIGEKGLALIKRFEGLELEAYLCPAKVPTIGWGHTGPDVRIGMVITEAEAQRLLEKDLDRFEEAVARAAPAASQDQFDAMVSLAYNIGTGAFLKSTLLKLHQAGEYRRAAEEFGRWVRAGGRVLSGLQRRRRDEAQLYRGEVA